MRGRWIRTIAMAAVMGGCSARPEGGGRAAGEPGSGPARAPDSATIARLEREAKALVRTDGCTASEQCGAAPVGAKPCGGPRYYLPYCRTTTDSVALFAKLDELKREEQAYNAARNVISDCMFAAPPIVEASGGKCVAAGR